MNGESEGI